MQIYYFPDISSTQMPLWERTSRTRFECKQKQRVTMVPLTIIFQSKAVQEWLSPWDFTFISKITATATSPGSMSELVFFLVFSIFVLLLPVYKKIAFF